MSQLIINSIISTSSFLLVALSFLIIYHIVRFFHFAHAVVFTTGAYLAYLFVIILDIGLWIGIPLAVIGACLIGCIVEWLIYKPLRKKNATSIILLLASLGIYIVLQNTISMLFGDDTKSIRTWPVVAGNEILGARITDVQIIILAVSLVLVILVAGYLMLETI